MKDGIKNVTRNTGTVAGNAATKVPTTAMTHRRGVAIHNPNATYDLWYCIVNKADSAPSITATNRDGVVGQDKTLHIALSDSMALYLQNSSGGATTSEYAVNEYDFPAQGDSGPIEATITGTVTVGTVDTELTTKDLDTGAGTDTKAVVGVVVAASGGSVDLAGGAGATTGGTVRTTVATDDAMVGALAETAPATDTASSGLNGRLQRIAQRITSLIALIPASLGQKAMSASLAVTVASDQSALQAVGNVAHDAADSGNPVKVGGKAISAEQTPVAAGDRQDLLTDLAGKLINLPYANPENFVSGAITTAMTLTTSTSLIGSPGGSLRNYITQITVSNAHATVGTDIVIQDGSGGTTLYTIPAAANYGGAVVTFPVPLRQPTTATAIFCANVTTGASTKVSASGYKGV